MADHIWQHRYPSRAQQIAMGLPRGQPLISDYWDCLLCKERSTLLMPPTTEIQHKDGDPCNNAIANLEIVVAPAE